MPVGLIHSLVLLALWQQPQHQNLHDFLGLGDKPDAAAAKAGEPLYKDNCSGCHGDKARGAQGPNLIRSPLVLHDQKGSQIEAVVRLGRAEGGMPPFPSLTHDQIYDIAEYIHLQVELTANRETYKQTYANLPMQGNPAQGKEFFESSCKACHSVSGDLAQIGHRYPQASALLVHIAWPALSKPRHATVQSQTSMISGIVLKCDDFDVVLQDDHGERHEWPRSSVKLTLEDPLAGHRQLLPRYSDADLHNLTVYLETFK